MNEWVLETKIKDPLIGKHHFPSQPFIVTHCCCGVTTKSFRAYLDSIITATATATTNNWHAFL
jgi:hypothetical protein